MGNFTGTPESIAADVLAEAGWDGALPVNPASLARHFSIDVLKDKTLVGSSNSGRCVVTDDGERIIIVNPADSVQRRRFTIAHELGHALLDDSGVHERICAINTYRENEARMNRFAAALLMPESEVRKAWKLGKNLKEMADIFGVPLISMRVRLECLKIVIAEDWQ